MAYDFRKNLIQRDDTILRALEIIDTHGVPVGLVHDDGRLVGLVTDGDIRRGLLRGVTLASPVSEVMNATPVSRPDTISDRDAAKVMRELGILQLPLVDAAGRLTGLKILTGLGTANGQSGDTPVLLMAGGLGTRLRPLTEDIPKPMIEVGGKPILATIVERFVEQGFTRLFISVNYKREMIENYFGDGGAHGARITYVHEPKAMGTAGALGLLPETLTAPLIVMNADLLSKVNFKHLLEFHNDRRAPATMGVREYKFRVPYGVVELDDDKLLLSRIEEKPEKNFFVNAGIYVIDPAALALVPKGEALDMPDLLELIRTQAGAPAVFPLREYWLDIGRLDDLERAKRDFAGVFPDE